MSEYLDRADEQDDKQEKASNSRGASGQKRKTIETKGPDKDKNFKVLHKDGSLATHLPDKEAEGSGALDGTVGLGT